MEQSLNNQQEPKNQKTKSGSLAHIPNEWPGAFGIFKFSKQAVGSIIWQFLGTVFLLYFLSFLIGTVFPERGMGAFAGQLVSLIVSAFFGVVITLLFLYSVRGISLKLGEAFSKAGQYAVNMAVLTILESLIAIASLILFIIPFFIIVPRLTLASYFLIDKNLGPIDALKASWNATEGNVGKVWGIFGASFVMALAIILIVGIYFLIMYSAAYAVLYVYLTREQPASTVPNTEQ